MTEQEREQSYQEFIDFKAPYFDTIVENGEMPWFWQADKSREVAEKLGLDDLATDDEIRRALWMRRYQKPEPPEGLKPIKSIKSYQRNNDARISESTPTCVGTHAA